MASNLHELHEARNKAVAEMRRIHGEFTGTGTPEQQAAWDKAEAEVSRLEKEIADEKAAVTSAAERSRRIEEIEARNKEALGDLRVGPDAGRRREENPERVALRHDASQGLALQAWFRAGKRRELSEEHRAACREVGIDPYSPEIEMGNPHVRYAGPAWASRGRQMQREFRVGLDVATSGAGKETIPQGFVNALERVTLAYASVRQVCRVLNTPTGAALPWPLIDDTSNAGALLAEATTFSTSVDPTTSAITFNAFKYSSKPIFASSELLRDTAMLEDEIPSLLGERLGRVEAVETTTGAGTTRCKGIVTCAGTGVTSASATAFTADELIDLYHMVDPSNRGGASFGWMFHDTCLKYLRKFKDGEGQYLWQPGMAMGVPDMLYGAPYTINQQMEPLVSNVPVTAKKHVLCGDFSKFVIRVVRNDRFYRLDELFRQTDQTAFIAFRELDSNTIKASALKVLLQA